METLSKVPNCKASYRAIEEDSQLLFKSDKLGISVTQFTKFIYDSIEYMSVNSKLSVNAFQMSSKELNHPHLTSKHRSMPGLFKVMRSDDCCNIENNDPNEKVNRQAMC